MHENPNPDGSSPDGSRPVLVHVCVTCKREGDDPEAPRQGSLLRNALAQSLPGSMMLQPVECLGNCKRSCTVALSSPGTWTYVFGDLTAESGADVVAGANLLAHSTDGLMPWRGRPEVFKRSMIARIPPMTTLKEAAE